MRVRIGVSARHVHLNQDDFFYLFGEGCTMTKLKDLYQGDEFACAETLTIKTDKGQIDNVRVLGPVRDYTQIEISKTDSYVLGLNPPIRDSGDLEGSSPIALINGDKVLHKEEGCIIANRHLHINNEDALKYGIKDKQLVKLKIGGEKGGILDNIHVKMNDTYTLEVHLDLDDANAHLVKNGDEGELIINE